MSGVRSVRAIGAAVLVAVSGASCVTSPESIDPPPDPIGTPSTTRVSVASDGIQGNGITSAVSISGDDRYIGFVSAASNLVPATPTACRDVFVHDVQTNTTSRVVVAVDGAQTNSPSISADGRYIAFASDSSGLVPGDNNDESDVFVHDRQTATTTRVSVASDGSPANERSYFASISGDGRFVAFSSIATNW